MYTNTVYDIPFLTLNFYTKFTNTTMYKFSIHKIHRPRYRILIIIFFKKALMTRVCDFWSLGFSRYILNLVRVCSVGQRNMEDPADIKRNQYCVYICTPRVHVECVHQIPRYSVPLQSCRGTKFSMSHPSGRKDETAVLQNIILSIVRGVPLGRAAGI